MSVKALWNGDEDGDGPWLALLEGNWQGLAVVCCGVVHCVTDAKQRRIWTTLPLKREM